LQLTPLSWLPDTISVVELLWTVPALYGIGLYTRRYVRSRTQRVEATRIGINGELGLVYRMRCIRNAGLILVYSLFMGAGVLAMMLPEGPTSNPDDSRAWAIAVFIMLGEIVPIYVGHVLDHYEHAMAELLSARLVAERRRREHSAKCQTCGGLGYVEVTA
jgi:hypothetical protein